MARGLNKVMLIGNLGNDPEVRYSPSGSAIANITIATSESWKDKNTGQKVDKTEWHRVVMFNRLGEIAGEYLKKGSKVYIEGKLQTRKWQDKNSGQDRYTTEIVASEMQMLDSRGEGAANFSRPAASNQAAPNQNQGGGYQQQGGQPQQGQQQQGQQQGQQQQGGQQQQPPVAQPVGAGDFADFDDDIPF